jgi:hypothetical protein
MQLSPQVLKAKRLRPQSGGGGCVVAASPAIRRKRELIMRRKPMSQTKCLVLFGLAVTAAKGP